MPNITAIIPAFNEAPRIGHALAALLASGCFQEIIVIDDGSTDQTHSVAAAFPVHVLRLHSNQGKGAAMAAGVAASSADIYFFCDADILGLQPLTIQAVLQPVIDGKLDMFIAMRDRPIFHIAPWLSHRVPLLGGERAVTARLWHQVPNRYKQGFRIEAALNFYARYYGHGLGSRVITGLTQTIKEKKYGLFPGFFQRIFMSCQVGLTYLRLFWEHITGLIAK